MRSDSAPAIGAVMKPSAVMATSPESRRSRETPEHLDDRRAFDLVLGKDALEHRGLEDAETDPQPDGHHDNAHEERDAPAPGQELIARVPTEEQHGDVGEEQSGRRAELRP